MTVPVPVSIAGRAHFAAPPRVRKTRSLAAVLRSAESPVLVTWFDGSLRLPLRTTVLATGVPGGGKSHWVTGCALALSLRGVRVLFMSVEERQSATTASRFSRVLKFFGDPPPPPGLQISDNYKLAEATCEIAAFEAEGPGVVVIDSLTALGASPAWVSELSTGQLGILAVAHVNSAGGAYGGPRQAHDVDVVVEVADFTASIVKSRWFDPNYPRTMHVDEPERLPISSTGASVVAFPERGVH